MSVNNLEYTCKILPLGNLASLAIAVNFSMILMFIGIFSNLPVWLIVFVLVSSMFLLLNYLTSMAMFSISDNYLSREILSDRFIFKKMQHKKHIWNNILSYKNGTNTGGYRGEYQFLEIKFKHGEVWYITDMYGEKEQDFMIYINAFLKMVDSYNNKTPEAIPSQPSATTINTEHLKENKNNIITREKTFYETIYAKLFTIAIGIFLVFVLLNFRAYLNGGSIFKIVVVIIPGFIYMAYRSFIKKSN